MAKSIKHLQAIVNDISAKLGGIDSPKKLAQAKRMADKLDKGDLLTIVYQALDYRCTADTAKMIREFIENARK